MHVDIDMFYILANTVLYKTVGIHLATDVFFQAPFTKFLMSTNVRYMRYQSIKNLTFYINIYIVVLCWYSRVNC